MGSNLSTAIKEESIYNSFSQEKKKNNSPFKFQMYWKNSEIISILVGKLPGSLVLLAIRPAPPITSICYEYMSKWW